jgi:hypothetical protein
LVESDDSDEVDRLADQVARLACDDPMGEDHVCRLPRFVGRRRERRSSRQVEAASPSSSEVITGRVIDDEFLDLGVRRVEADREVARERDDAQDGAGLHGDEHGTAVGVEHAPQ